MFDRLPALAWRRMRREMLRTAFAGDGIEKAFVRSAISAFSIAHLVETGTHSGKTSMWLGATFPDCRVYTCEILPDVHEAASKVLARQSNVRTYLADSASWIAELCHSELRDEAALFFLDAHGMADGWGLEHPLLCELRSIEGRDAPSVIIIDDFKVPGRVDFAFCVNETDTSFNFPPDGRLALAHALDMEFIAEAISDDDLVLYPKYDYADALTYQRNPAHEGLVGYVVILHTCPPSEQRALLASNVVAKHFVTWRP